MLILFCNNILESKKVDPDYKAEYQEALKNGFTINLISLEDIIAGKINKAITAVKSPPKITPAFYRGWMLSVANYKLLYFALLDKNVQLINSPEAYEHCHYLPKSYSKIADYTPISHWIKCSNSIHDDVLKKLLANFNQERLIVKDFVKSEKHNWEEACFIPNASDTDQAIIIIRNFLELRGDQLNEGIVLRKFEDLEFLTNHSKSGMPLTKEYRLFFINKKRILTFNYWDQGNYKKEEIDFRKFEKIASTIQSNFFTMDIAKKENGEWIIMELGDGQVAGLPEERNTLPFYQKLNPLNQHHG